jgi:hypothetical protein
MGQYGMQMPGGRRRGGSSPDVYTGLLFLSVAALAAACLVLYFSGKAVAPGGNPLSMHEPGAPIELAQDGR